MAGKKGMHQHLISSPAAIAEFRAKINAGMLRDRLQKHADGKVRMTATQIRAAEILLRKCIPDLSSVEHAGGISHRHFVAQLPPVTVHAEQWVHENQLLIPSSSGDHKPALN